MDIKKIDREINAYRGMISGFAGHVTTEMKGIYAQRIHELQQIKRRLLDPESFQKPVRQYAIATPKPQPNTLLLLTEETK